VLIISGTREKIQLLGEFPRTCGSCGVSGPHRLQRRYQVAHLELIPLYVASSRCEAICGGCGATVVLERAPESAPSLPYRYRLGFAAVILAASLVLGLLVPLIIEDFPGFRWTIRGMGAILFVVSIGFALLKARVPDRSPAERGPKPSRHAPFRQAPMTVMNGVGFLAAIACFIFGFVALDASRERLKPGVPRSRWPLQALYGSAGVVALSILSEVARRTRKDRSLDVLDFLYPGLRVSEAGGVHLALIGTMRQEADGIVGRMILLAQNCHQGKKRVPVKITPAGPCAFLGGGGLSFDVHLAPAEVRAVFVRRVLDRKVDRARFNLKADVRTQTLGRRVRYRIGYGLSTVDPALVNAIALSTGHLTIQSGELQMAVVPPGSLIWVEALPPFPPLEAGKSDANLSVWTRDQSWSKDPAVLDWLSATSKSFRDAVK